jgi:hypothetical protein
MSTVESVFTPAALERVLRCRRFRYAATDVQLHHWRLGFNQSRLHLYLLRDFLRTGLAVHHTTYLRAYPLSQHAIVPFAFRRQVSWVS